MSLHDVSYTKHTKMKRDSRTSHRFIQMAQNTRSFLSLPLNPLPHHIIDRPSSSRPGFKLRSTAAMYHIPSISPQRTPQKLALRNPPAIANQKRNKPRHSISPPVSWFCLFQCRSWIAKKCHHTHVAQPRALIGPIPVAKGGIDDDYHAQLFEKGFFFCLGM